MNTALIPPILIFIAFLLLLLVSLSVPIIQSIYLFRLAANVSSSLFRSGASASAKFGVWGYCLSAITVSIVGFDKSNDAQCSDRRLGYTIDSTVADALNADEILNFVSRTTTAALVLHPVAASLAFLALLISLFVLKRGSNSTHRLSSLITFGVGLLAAILTTIAFLIDVIVVGVLRKRVRNATDGALQLNWGDAVWMTLAAAIALWVAVVGAFCGIFSRNIVRNKQSNTY